MQLLHIKEIKFLQSSQVKLLSIGYQSATELIDTWLLVELWPIDDHLIEIIQSVM